MREAAGIHWVRTLYEYRTVPVYHLSWLPYEAAYCSCDTHTTSTVRVHTHTHTHTHGENLVKSSGCTDNPRETTKDRPRTNHEIRESPPNPSSQSIICYGTVRYEYLMSNAWLMDGVGCVVATVRYRTSGSKADPPRDARYDLRAIWSTDTISDLASHPTGHSRPSRVGSGQSITRPVLRMLRMLSTKQEATRFLYKP